MEIEIWKAVVTFLVGILASWYGSQVGGGGLLFIPYLIYMGLPLHFVVATHKFVVFFGRIFSTRKYLQANQVLWSYIPLFMVVSLVGVVIGNQIFITLPEEKLRWIAIVGLCLPIIFIGNQEYGVQKIVRSKKFQILGSILLLVLSIWSALFSAGTGTIGMYIVVLFFGTTFIQAKATRNIASTPGLIYSVLFLGFHGLINFHYGIPAAIGYMIGSHYGAQYALKKGNYWIRILLIIVVLASIIKLLI